MFSRGFREVFARFSRGFRFKNIFVKGSREQKKKQFLRAAGAPAPRRRRTGAPAARKNWEERFPEKLRMIEGDHPQIVRSSSLMQQYVRSIESRLGKG